MADTAHWRQHWAATTAWTAQELAKLGCGWDPGRGEIPDPAAYHHALDRILRATRVEDIPTIALRIPATREEFVYGAAPLYRPWEVADWAARHLPGFPYAVGEIRPPGPAGDAMDERERTSLLIIIAALAHLAHLHLDEPTKAAGTIAAAARDLTVTISPRTISTHLRRVPAALARRQP